MDHCAVPDPRSRDMSNSGLPSSDPAANVTGASSRRRIVCAGAAILVVAASAVAAVWFWPRPIAPITPPADPDDSLLVVTNPGYVGPDACAECHASRVAE